MVVRGVFWERHCGFTPTEQAVEDVLEPIKDSRDQWCLLVTLDIQNTFNCAKWNSIIN